jgi:hypothetical protein
MGLHFLVESAFCFYLNVQLKSLYTLMVGQSVCQGIEPTLGLVTRYYFLSEGCFLKGLVISYY